MHRLGVGITYQWYNNDHHHSALAGFTPGEVFTGEYGTIADKRETALDGAYQRTPNRFISDTPKITMPPSDVFINPVPDDADEQTTLATGVNFPTLKRANAI
jgi:putative transposase